MEYGLKTMGTHCFLIVLFFSFMSTHACEFRVCSQTFCFFPCIVRYIDPTSLTNAVSDLAKAAGAKVVLATDCTGVTRDKANNQFHITTKHMNSGRLGCGLNWIVACHSFSLI